MQYCAICDEPIMEEKCYVLDHDIPDGACVCKDCMEHELKILLNSKMNKLLAGIIYDEIKYERGMEKVPETVVSLSQEENPWI